VQFLDDTTTTLLLSETKTKHMYDSATVAQKSINADLPDYIMDRKVVRTALRKAKKDIPDEKWDDFITNISDSSKRD